MIEYEPLKSRPADWDTLITRFDTKTLFHQGAWLDHVQTIHPNDRIVYFRLVRDGEVIGYHCGLKISKMLIPIHGSPLGGTGTNFMGPLVNAATDQREMIDGLVRMGGLKQFLHLELSNPWLSRDVMIEAGFTVQDGVTHVVDVPPEPEAAWQNLKSAARNRIRKGEKNGLVVERTETPTIVDHFFDQFTEVYGKQGMVAPFGKDRPRSLFENLLSSGNLLPLWVRRGDEILATGLFPYDEHAIYFWGAASWLKYQSLCPNEALHWAVIEFAAQHGIPQYNMCGGTSQFKSKFGGKDVPNRTYYRSSIPFLKFARHMYRRMHFRSLNKQSVAP